MATTLAQFAGWKNNAAVHDQYRNCPADALRELNLTDGARVTPDAPAGRMQGNLQLDGTVGESPVHNFFCRQLRSAVVDQVSNAWMQYVRPQLLDELIFSLFGKVRIDQLLNHSDQFVT
ncbi:hypothetical protein [Streptomyces caeruleatus]|uniref:hypothetical protein n=1 Tax=Streptomyces caeruleatus TaxID=661399 RepID=UPI00131D8AA1|nr:hypothetical protein [Streptomyces caeruleatus]